MQLTISSQKRIDLFLDVSVFHLHFLLTEHTFLFFFSHFSLAYQRIDCLACFLLSNYVSDFALQDWNQWGEAIKWVVGNFEIGNLEIQVKPNYILNDSTLQYGVCMRIKSYHYSMVSACVLSPMQTKILSMFPTSVMFILLGPNTVHSTSSLLCLVKFLFFFLFTFKCV